MKTITRWLHRVLCPLCPACQPPPAASSTAVATLLPEIRDVHHRLDDLITALERYDEALHAAQRPEPPGEERTLDAD